jgi:hypothetical protein
MTLDLAKSDVAQAKLAIVGKRRKKLDLSTLTVPSYNNNPKALVNVLFTNLCTHPLRILLVAEVARHVACTTTKAISQASNTTPR